MEAGERIVFVARRFVRPAIGQGRNYGAERMLVLLPAPELAVARGLQVDALVLDADEAGQPIARLQGAHSLWHCLGSLGLPLSAAVGLCEERRRPRGSGTNVNFAQRRWNRS